MRLQIAGKRVRSGKCAAANGPTPRSTRSAKSYGWHDSGRGAVWLARLNGVQEVAGSNPVAPTCDAGAKVAMSYGSPCVLEFASRITRHVLTNAIDFKATGPAAPLGWHR